MGLHSGRLTQKRVMETYKGFSIISFKITEYWYLGGYYHNIYFKYQFCKEGEENRTSQYYSTSFDNIEECKKAIDNFILDDCLYFTEEERNKYIYRPNHKYGWGFTKKRLLRLLNDWKKADKRIKILYEDRLTDANFHELCEILCENGYEKAKEWVYKEF